MITNIMVGVGMFVLGVLTALAWAYRDQIRIFLKLQDSGTLDAGSKIAGGIKDIVESFQGKKSLAK